MNNQDMLENTVENVVENVNNVDNYLEEQSQGYKLFVGNVPFKCSHYEFREVFEHEDGFLKAELIHRPRSRLTRGFGFVEFKTEEDLENVLKNEYELLDRTLRITKYSNENKPKTNDKYSSLLYKLFVRDLGDTTESELEGYFSKYGNVHKCYLLNIGLSNS